MPEQGNFLLLLQLFLRDKDLAILSAFSILASMFPGIWSIGLFEFLIRSSSLQVPNISRNIHSTTRQLLKTVTPDKEGQDLPEVTRG